MRKGYIELWHNQQAGTPDITLNILSASRPPPPPLRNAKAVLESDQAELMGTALSPSELEIFLKSLRPQNVAHDKLTLKNYVIRVTQFTAAATAGEFMNQHARLRGISPCILLPLCYS